MKEVILTGDRPTGKLHLGHYVGTLKNRVYLQDKYDCYFIIADYQVLVDHLDKYGEISRNVREVVLDWLSIGMSPEKSTFFIQSAIPQLSELTNIFSMLVTVARLRRNPTIKSEANDVGVDSEKDNIVYGFLGYPVSQAADILLFRANSVPVGIDQKPHIEQTQEIAQRFNYLFGDVFPRPKALIGDVPRLSGLDGTDKMSKSKGNAIYLSDSADDVKNKVFSAYTDPLKMRKNDPGHPLTCVVFQYTKAFFESDVGNLQEDCLAGKVGCVACKKLLSSKLNGFLEPIREKRLQYEANPEYVRDIVSAGCEKARKRGEETMSMVRDAVGLSYSEYFTS